MELALNDLNSAEDALRHQGVMNLSIAQAYVYLPWQHETLPKQTLEYVHRSGIVRVRLVSCSRPLNFVTLLRVV
jgi:hypothetical protein